MEKTKQAMERLMGQEEVASILTQFPQLNFVQRIIHPEKYPSMDWGGGKKATHQMAWGEADGRFFVYPTIVFDERTKELKPLDPDAAWKYAKENNELIEFPSAEAADHFSKTYKQFWEDAP